ncbi:10228_t:CDS:2, partial [Funneliformis mosseae]
IMVLRYENSTPSFIEFDDEFLVVENCSLLAAYGINAENKMKEQVGSYHYSLGLRTDRLPPVVFIKDRAPFLNVLHACRSLLNTRPNNYHNTSHKHTYRNGPSQKN